MCQRLLVVLLAFVAACTPALDWREVRQPEQGFSVALPGKPLIASRELAFDGAALPMTMVSVGRDGTLFAVGTARLPSSATRDAATLDATLARFAAALRRNVHAEQAATTSTPESGAAVAPFAGNFAGSRTVRAQSAFHVRGDAGSGGKARAVHLYARLVVVDDRLYQVVALGAADELTAQALDTFFQSFRLTPGT
jgi:hypothetical protein